MALLMTVGLNLFTVETSLGQSRSQKPNKAKNRVSPSEEQLILHYTNIHRQRKGMRPLKLSRALRYLAQKHNRNMCVTKDFNHESNAFPQGWKTFGGRLKKIGLEEGGENIAYRTVGERKHKWAKEVVTGWMKSPPHRKNILNARYRYLGVGFLSCPNKLGYATQVFSPQAGAIRQARTNKPQQRRSKRATALDKRSALR